MRILISYFYNVRLLNRNQIPLSTAVWDPKWFHDGKGNGYSFVDKRGVINGLRFDAFVPNRTLHDCCRGRDKCSTLNPPNCKFLKGYREQIYNMDFNSVMNTLCKIGNVVKDYTGLASEPQIVLLVYEAPNNPCSERCVLVDWFKDNNYYLEELKF